MAKLFTKSAFKVALSCPWKLYYYRNPQKYNNANESDEFLESLAEGGFQVGELAKYYCGVDADADLKDLKGYVDSLKRTAELFERENVTIAEAAFKFGNMFVRVDILKKRGNQIELIEVKAKSFNSETDRALVKDQANSKHTKVNSVNSEYREYIYDIAFQKYVVENALKCDYPQVEFIIKANLMMADKSKVADVDGLNQLFKIRKDKNGHSDAFPVTGFDVKLRSAKVEVLSVFKDFDDVCDMIISGKTTEQGQNAADAKAQRDNDRAMAAYWEKVNNAKAKGKVSRAKCPSLTSPEYIDNPWMQGLLFKDFVEKACNAYCANERYEGTPVLCGTCFKCEFCGTGITGTLNDGKAECWKRVPDYGKKPMVEILNGSSLGAKRGEWVRKEVYFLDQIDETRLKKSSDKPHVGLDDYERKWLQIGLETEDKSILSRFSGKIVGNTYLDVEGLRKEMDEWKKHFPLHMIDFETTAVALPYYEGMRPYEQVAFQFSHHVINEDGTIEHRGQYLNEDVTKFPNFEFIRELKKQLGEDEGYIFRYATHENTILREIARQLDESTVGDKDELIEFIRSITHNDKKENGEVYTGKRDMIDLLEVVKRYFYDLNEMHGSNSIKQVLPAVLNCSQELQDKYSKPIYGKEIKSCNYTEDNPKAWITFDKYGHVESPYHLLESVGKLIGLSAEEIDKIEAMSSDDETDFEVANGGAALTAYNKLMFCEDTVMNEALRSALLRYCELDTMSMVFIWEYFNDEVYGVGEKGLRTSTPEKSGSGPICDAPLGNVIVDYSEPYESFGWRGSIHLELDLGTRSIVSSGWSGPGGGALSADEQQEYVDFFSNVNNLRAFFDPKLAYSTRIDTRTVHAREYTLRIQWGGRDKVISVGYPDIPFKHPFHRW